MTHDAAEMLCEVFEVVFPLGEQDGRAAFLDRRDDIVDDALVYARHGHELMG